MEVLAHFEILDPPTKYVYKAKRKIEMKNGKPQLKEETYYLTANLFYGGNVHWSMVRKIINYSKDYLLLFFIDIPKMEKCRIELTYHHPNASYDLDNKLYFWNKVIQDLFTPPTKKEIKYAKKYNRPIKSIYVLDDDSVKYIDEINWKHKIGQHKLEVKLIGRPYVEQTILFQ